MTGRPFPVMDLSSSGWIACMAGAERSQVGDHAPDGRPAPPHDPRYAVWASAPDRICPYCRSAEPLGGEEHVLSVALGNWFWVIPPNVVCGKCNNGVLSVLDTKLQQHPFISLMRTVVNIPGRKGQAPAVGASNLKLHRSDDGTLHLTTNHARHVKRDAEEVKFVASWSNFGPPQRRAVARALLKVGLGVLWLARGPEETSRSAYDHVRHAIQGRRDIPLRHGFGNSQMPNHVLQILVAGHQDHRGLRVGLDYFGIQLWAESAGYREEASDDFLSKEIDTGFVELPEFSSQQGDE